MTGNFYVPYEQIKFFTQKMKGFIVMDWRLDYIYTFVIITAVGLNGMIESIWFSNLIHLIPQFIKP